MPQVRSGQVRVENANATVRGVWQLEMEAYTAMTAQEGVTWPGGGVGTFIRDETVGGRDIIYLYRTAGPVPKVGDLITGDTSTNTGQVSKIGADSANRFNQIVFGLVPNRFTVRGSGIDYAVASAPGVDELTLQSNYNETTQDEIEYGVTNEFTPFYSWPLVALGDVDAPTILAETIRKIENQVKGLPTKSVTAAETLLPTDAQVLADASGGSFTLTLPSAAFVVGRTFIVYNIGATGDVTLDGSGSELINGELEQALLPGQDLAIISDGIGWRSIPDRLKLLTHIYLSVDQVVTDNIVTSVFFDSTESDEGDWHDPVTNNERVTVDRPGVFLISGQIKWQGVVSPVGRRRAWFVENGVDTIFRDGRMAISDGNVVTGITITSPVFLNAGEYIELKCQHKQGSNLNAEGGTSKDTFLKVYGPL